MLTVHVVVVVGSHWSYVEEGEGGQLGVGELQTEVSGVPAVSATAPAGP